LLSISEVWEQQFEVAPGQNVVAYYVYYGRSETFEGCLLL